MSLFPALLGSAIKVAKNTRTGLMFPESEKLYLFLVESIVKCEGVVFDVLGDAVDLVLGLMDFDLGIGATDRVDLPRLLLLLENRPLTHAYR